MSVKGIDTQIMITRATEFVKDSSAQLKKGELMQDYLAVQARAAEEVDKQKVIKTIDAQETNVLLDKDGESDGGYSSSGKRKRNNEDEEEADLRMAPSSGSRKIDIKV